MKLRHRFPEQTKRIIFGAGFVITDSVSRPEVEASQTQGAKPMPCRDSHGKALPPGGRLRPRIDWHISCIKERGLHDDMETRKTEKERIPAMDTAKMMERLDISSITALSEKLNQRKKLLDITNQIHAAQNIKDILVEHKEGILALFNALLITIYVADKPRSELYSLYLAGSQLKEIRLPINNRSIAGFVANTGRGVSIADVYDKEELKKIDKALFFDEAWDRQSGYRTAQVLALPVMHENTLMGVIQIVNRKGGGRFTDDERALLEEIAEVLGIALYNQHRVSSRRKTRFDYLVNHNLMKDADLETAFTEARRSNEPIEEILMKRFRISRDDIGRSLEDFYRCLHPLQRKALHPRGPSQEPQARVPPPRALGAPGKRGRREDPRRRRRPQQHPEEGHDREPPEDEVRRVLRLAQGGHHQVHQPLLSDAGGGKVLQRPAGRRGPAGRGPGRVRGERRL